MNSVETNLDEMRRQAYLAAIGITPWSPRYILPAAKESQKTIITELPVGDLSNESYEEAAIASSTEALTPSAEATSHSSDQREAFEARHSPRLTLDVHESDNSEQEKRATTNLGAAKKDIVSQFSMACVDIGQKGLLVTETDFSRTQGLLKPHMSLINSISFALGYKPTQFVKPTEFRWPIQGLQLEGGEDMAIEAVTAFLEKNIETNNKEWLLLLGDQLKVIFDTVSNGSLNQLRIVYGPSVDNMLIHTESKRTLWQSCSSIVPSA